VSYCPLIFEHVRLAVERVIEDTPEKVIGADGKEEYGSIEYGGPNPNGFEVDNLYRKSRVGYDIRRGGH
jgi:hypothetical protein